MQVPQLFSPLEYRTAMGAADILNIDPLFREKVVNGDIQGFEIAVDNQIILLTDITVNYPTTTFSNSSQAPSNSGKIRYSVSIRHTITNPNYTKDKVSAWEQDEGAPTGLSQNITFTRYKEGDVWKNKHNHKEYIVTDIARLKIPGYIVLILQGLKLFWCHLWIAKGE